ncbi:unnamed protein product [Rhizophagus irregularis]|nr:unnamed protein product [Rhizophagus irregularis]CAB4417017.1 unnamed protein product [Rhizophagus irregularis]CAB4434713.1 unnamed protein product [Rhizophagus irregularis]
MSPNPVKDRCCHCWKVCHEDGVLSDENKCLQYSLLEIVLITVAYFGDVSIFLIEGFFPSYIIRRSSI